MQKKKCVNLCDLIKRKKNTEMEKMKTPKKDKTRKQTCNGEIHKNQISFNRKIKFTRRALSLPIFINFLFFSLWAEKNFLKFYLKIFIAIMSNNFLVYFLRFVRGRHDILNRYLFYFT